MWVGKPSVHSGWLFSMFWLKIDHMYGMLFLLENIVFEIQMLEVEYAAGNRKI